MEEEEAKGVDPGAELPEDSDDFELEGMECADAQTATVINQLPPKTTAINQFDVGVDFNLERAP